jgi:hypothetical protein
LYFQSFLIDLDAAWCNYGGIEAGLGFELPHPARVAAAEAEAPASILRRVRKDMMKPNRNGLAGFVFVKHKYVPRYDGYVTVTDFPLLFSFCKRFTSIRPPPDPAPA